MNLQDPITKHMTTEVKTLHSEDRLQAAKELFEDYGFHHIPVVDQGVLIGILSKTDYLYFLKHYDPYSNEKYLNQVRLKNYQVKEVMTRNVIALSSNSTLKEALEIFTENRIHAIPILNNNKLVGIITPHDLIFRLLHPNNNISAIAS